MLQSGASAHAWSRPPRLSCGRWFVAMRLWRIIATLSSLIWVGRARRYWRVVLFCLWQFHAQAISPALSSPPYLRCGALADGYGGSTVVGGCGIGRH